ncbi:dUTP diphosphatase [Carnobacterium gallinarum]|uniref:dUTP diphosphatase n=1 Tax=Carnobacterium gallinarum TaxID=2749 RepID=UPI0005519244|nr:dUTP diphosphatase [Carnobacterium gallinarum]
MTKKRGFEVIEKYQEAGIQVPTRATKQAAGYDFEAAEDIVIPTFWKTLIKTIIWEVTGAFKEVEISDRDQKFLKPILVPTGIKAYMAEDEYLQLANRSGNPLKSFLILANGVGVIDADYYNNLDNEGHIMFQFLNFGLSDKVIKKGDRIGQGIFLPFLKADNEAEIASERTGGFGSSGK